jgi:hypothetical protein
VTVESMDGGCLESVRQDAILRCGHLECHDIGTCESQVRAKGTGTILTNAAGRCAARLCYLSGDAKCMYQCHCT